MFSRSRDRVRGEVLTRRLLHAFLWEEDKAAHKALELGRVRGEDWVEVVVGAVDRLDCSDRHESDGEGVRKRTYSGRWGWNPRAEEWDCKSGCVLPT